MSKKHDHSTHHAQHNRLRRIEGQVRGLQKMIAKEKYCISILQQFKSVHAALHVVEREIMRKHIENCVFSVANKKPTGKAKVKLDEVVNLIKSLQG